MLFTVIIVLAAITAILSLDWAFSWGIIGSINKRYPHWKSNTAITIAITVVMAIWAVVSAVLGAAIDNAARETQLTNSVQFLIYTVFAVIFWLAFLKFLLSGAKKDIDVSIWALTFITLFAFAFLGLASTVLFRMLDLTPPFIFAPIKS